MVDHGVQVSRLRWTRLHAGESWIAERQSRVVFSEVPFGEPCEPHAQNRVVVELDGSGLRLRTLCQEIANVFLGEFCCSLQQRVADNVRAEMARHGVSAKQLAEALGMSIQSLSVKWRGDVPFSLKDLGLIAPLLGMTPGALVDGNVVYVDFVRRGLCVDKCALAPEGELADADAGESAVAGYRPKRGV